MQFPQAAEAQRAVGGVDVVGIDFQVGDEDVAHFGGHALVDLQAHDRAEMALAQVVFHHQQQVIGLLFLQLHVAVARHPKRMGGDDLHAWKEAIQIGGDDFLRPDELLHGRRRELVGVKALQRHQPRQGRRHLDAGEVQFAGLGVAHLHGQVETEIGDVGKRPAGVGSERRQHGKDLAHEIGAQLVALRLGKLLIAQHVNVGLGQLGIELLAPDDVRLGEELGQRAVNIGQLLARQQAVGRRGGQAQLELLLQPGDAHHEKLIHVAMEDGQKLDPLQQRVLGLRLVQHAAVELDITEFAVDVEAGIAQVNGRRGWRRGGLLAARRLLFIRGRV